MEFGLSQILSNQFFASDPLLFLYMQSFVLIIKIPRYLYYFFSKQLSYNKSRFVFVKFKYYQNFLLYWTIREPHSMFSKFRNIDFEEYIIFFLLMKFLYSQPPINDLWRFQSQKIKIQSHLKKLVKYFFFFALLN